MSVATQNKVLGREFQYKGGQVSTLFLLMTKKNSNQTATKQVSLV